MFPLMYHEYRTVIIQKQTYLLMKSTKPIKLHDPFEFLYRLLAIRHYELCKLEN
jgi:hypothetical protein